MRADSGREVPEGTRVVAWARGWWPGQRFPRGVWRCGCGTRSVRCSTTWETTQIPVVLGERARSGFLRCVAQQGAGRPVVRWGHQLVGRARELLAAPAAYEEGDRVRHHHGLVHRRLTERVGTAGPLDGDDGRLQVRTGERPRPAVGAAPHDVDVATSKNAGGEGVTVIVRDELVAGPEVQVHPDLETAVRRLVQRQPVEQHGDAARDAFARRRRAFRVKARSGQLAMD